MKKFDNLEQAIDFCADDCKRVDKMMFIFQHGRNNFICLNEGVSMQFIPINATLKVRVTPNAVYQN